MSWILPGYLDHYNPTTYLETKHPPWCFVWFERSQLRDFAEQSINRDHVGIPWSWQFDKYIGFFSTGELELRSWERCGQFSSNRPCGPCVCYLLGLVLPSLVNQVSVWTHMTFRGCGWPSAAREAFWVHLSGHQAFFNFSSLLVWLIVVVCSFCLAWREQVFLVALALLVHAVGKCNQPALSENLALLKR